MAVSLVPDLPPRAIDGSVRETIPAVSNSGSIDCGVGSGMLVVNPTTANSHIRQSSSAADALTASNDDIIIGTTVPRAYAFDVRSRFAVVHNPTGASIGIRFYIVRLK